MAKVPVTAKAIKLRLAEIDVTPRKTRGQNFLTDVTVAERMVAFSGVGDGDRVLEIGPGLGSLTQCLMAQVGQLFVVEIQPQFIAHLKEIFSGAGKLTFIESDILSLRLADITPTKLCVVANLPYSISTDVLLWLIRERAQLKGATLLLQREFAERLASPPGSRAYGSLSVALQLYAEASLGEVIAGDKFSPAVAVESRFLKIAFRSQPQYEVTDAVWFERVVRAAFGQRRKTLLNSLLGSAVTKLNKSSKNALAEKLLFVGIEPSRRAETLSVEEFVRLAESLRD